MTPEHDRSQDSEQIAQKIKELANQGLFTEAEQLRDQMMRDNPMALNLIVSTGEVIEEEKTKNLDLDHMAVWKTLYDDLSSEETNCLFYGTKQATLESGKLLVSQGKLNNRLFFIDNGRVTVFYHKDKKNIPIIQLSRGDILGEETFFGISFCSLSAVTQSEVNLRHISRKEAQTWHDKAPGLFEKLADFCRKHGKSERAVVRKNLERRTYQRHPCKGNATAYLIDGQGNKSQTYFRGGIEDISQSGVCFSMKCSKQETARALLGKEIEITIIIPEGEIKRICHGTIVKVSFHLHNDYSVHVRFKNLLEEAEFKPMISNNDSDAD